MKLAWDKTGERLYEAGVDRVVLYKNRTKSLCIQLLCMSMKYGEIIKMPVL